MFEKLKKEMMQLFLVFRTQEQLEVMKSFRIEKINTRAVNSAADNAS